MAVPSIFAAIVVVQENGRHRAVEWEEGEDLGPAPKRRRVLKMTREAKLTGGVCVCGDGNI